MRLAEQRALVIGGAQGIGRVLSRALVEAGAAVILSDPDADQAESFARTLGQTGLGWDMSGDAPPADVIGEPDLAVITCDMSGPSGAVLNDLTQAFDAVVEQILPQMQGGGAALAVLALPPAPDFRHEAAAGWLAAATRALASRFASAQIRVNAVIALLDDAPGLPSFMGSRVASPLPAVPLATLPGPRTVATAALSLCGADAASVTGQVLRLDGGLNCGGGT